MRVQKILCPVDFSEHSREGLHRAAAMAKIFDASIEVLHVYDLSHPGRDVMDGIKAEEHLEAIDRDLAAWKREAEALGVKAVATLSVQGVPWDQITARASEGDFGLVVIATRGRSGIPRLLLGSTAERVVRHAMCPVMTVRSAL
jgi:nucleotide-binding universal stress UspA family protein